MHSPTPAATLSSASGLGLDDSIGFLDSQSNLALADVKANGVLQLASRFDDIAFQTTLVPLYRRNIWLGIEEYSVLQQ